jgi:hypothetical protein
MVAAVRLSSWKLRTVPPTFPRRLKPVVAFALRSIWKPATATSLSFHVTVIRLLAVATAVTALGTSMTAPASEIATGMSPSARTMTIGRERISMVNRRGVDLPTRGERN